VSIVRWGTYWIAALHWIVTCLYGAISTQAFVQEQFLGPGLFAPLTVFADWHEAIGLVVLVVWAVVRWRTPGRRTWRDAAAATAWVVAIGFIAAATPLSEPLSRNAAVVLTALAAAMVTLVAMAEWRALPDAPKTSIDRSFSDLAACSLAGTSAAIAHAAATLWIEPTGGVLLSSMMWSIRLHLLLAGGVFLVTAAIRATAAMTARPAATERALAILALATALSSFLL
jgi:hypothetical protein